MATSRLRGAICGRKRDPGRYRQSQRHHRDRLSRPGHAELHRPQRQRRDSSFFGWCPDDVAALDSGSADQSSWPYVGRILYREAKRHRRHLGQPCGTYALIRGEFGASLAARKGEKIQTRAILLRYSIEIDFKIEGWSHFKIEGWSHLKIKRHFSEWPSTPQMAR